MKEAFAKIIADRGWGETQIEKILGNIYQRLKKRLPENTEPSLTAFQRKAIQAPNFWRTGVGGRPEHLMVQGATSAGKTLLCELNILDALSRAKKAIVLVPLKAMVHERTVQFRHDMGHGLPEYNINVFGSSGDYMENDERLINGDYDVAIIVYEKFFAMLSQGSTRIMEECDLLVVDELSMLESEQRGAKLEMSLEIVRRKCPNTRIMCLATCDCSTENVCKWLDIRSPIISTARPVELEEHIVNLNGEGIYRTIPKDHEFAGDEQEPESLSRQEEKIEVPNYKSEWKLIEKERQLLLSVLKRIYTKTPDARVLVFVAGQGKASFIANFLKDNKAKWVSAGSEAEPDRKFLSALSTCDHDEGQGDLIKNLIPAGIAYHHSGVSTTLRELIEEQFSLPNSNLRVIVATETLTVGVNLPFDAMIMLSCKVNRGQENPIRLTMQEYRNYIGRAGRLGLSNGRGETYLFVENTGDMDRYWRSYYHRDEVNSGLMNEDESGLAPYYLSLLNNSVTDVMRHETIFTEQDIIGLFNEGFLTQCIPDRTLSAKTLCGKLKDGHMAASLDDSRYAIRDFGARMAPYAFSLDTCEKIYHDFFQGYEHEGLPLGISQEDITSDRYLLDILYHICCHVEIQDASTLLYPPHNSSQEFAAKIAVIEALDDIIAQKDEEGKPQNVLWCDAHEGANSENNAIWLLLNQTNLIDERLKLHAAMRAIVLFYWTKGLSIREIKEKTRFGDIFKIITGDVERIADVAGFHLDAIYRCIQQVYVLRKRCGILKDDAAKKAFYALQTRVKYGMPRDLVIFANKHIHGLDRKRLLSLKKEAASHNLTPLQYLFLTPPGRIPETILTVAQQTQLRQAVAHSGSGSSISSLMGMIRNDPGAEITSEQERCLEAIVRWSDTEGTELPDLLEIYRNIKDIRNIPALGGVRISTDGEACNILWEKDNLQLCIGVLNSTAQNDSVRRFFEENRHAARILLVPDTLMPEELEAVFRQYERTALVDNVYFAFALAKAMRLPVDNGLALTEMLADLRGIFTRADYGYFPLVRYIRKARAEVKPRYRLLYGNNVDKRFEEVISESGLEAMLCEAEDLKDFEVLPWGSRLDPEEYDFTECPTVILLDRKDVTRSQSLANFIFKMRNQNHQFGNCILLLESQEAEAQWNSKEKLEELGQNNWSEQYNKIPKAVVFDSETALRTIRTYLKGWHHPGYLIGISYAHYDSQPAACDGGWKNDVELITALAEKLKGEYGEDLILFDRFDPAKKLFDENRGKTKSLDAYRNCRFYLILWNRWTYENENCQAERDIILQRCKDDTNKCMFLQTGHPGDPAVSGEYFSTPISEAKMDELFERIQELIAGLPE